MNRSPSSNRISYLDVGKALGIIIIVLCHVIHFESPVRQYLFSFVVPFFFVMSGMSFSIEKKKRYPEYLKRRFLSIMVPYFLFGIISILIYRILGEFAASALDKTNIDTDIGTNILNLLYGTSIKSSSLKFNQPLWFLPCLFMILNIGFGLRYLADKLNKFIRYRVYWAVVFAVSIVIFILFNDKIGLLRLPWGFATAVNMLPLFIIGVVLGRFARKMAVLPRRYFIAPAAICIAGGGVFAFLNEEVNYYSNRFENPYFFLASAILSSIGYIFLCVIISSSRPIEYVGRHSMPILTMHKFVVVFFQTIVPFTAAAITKENVMSFDFWACSLIITVVSIVCCLAVDPLITRFAPFFYGKRFTPKA